ncbi:hypothetical protein A9Q99_24225 [Gammaproteobacteria bacterium 45_16_T64]|nr:hypothetical protein A9Q99_24225 [Gammaproteobacteria bacterium 45_16_T64]
MPIAKTALRCLLRIGYGCNAGEWSLTSLFDECQTHGFVAVYLGVGRLYAEGQLDFAFFFKR